MFNQSNCGGYSLADIAAATGNGSNNNGWGGDNAWQNSAKGKSRN